MSLARTAILSFTLVAVNISTAVVASAAGDAPRKFRTYQPAGRAEISKARKWLWSQPAWALKRLALNGNVAAYVATEINRTGTTPVAGKIVAAGKQIKRVKGQLRSWFLQDFPHTPVMWLNPAVVEFVRESYHEPRDTGNTDRGELPTYGEIVDVHNRTRRGAP